MSLPPRRWYQFRLSTWFVLVAILAWAMLQWPWVVPRRQFSTMGLKQIGIVLSPPFAKFRTPPPVTPPTPWWWSIYNPKHEMINRALLYPALALAAFVGWKAAWAIGRRLKGRKVEQV